MPDRIVIRETVVKRDGELVGVDYARLRRLVEEAREDLFGTAGVAADRTWTPVVAEPSA